jgi:alpha-ribazole phosphatase
MTVYLVRHTTPLVPAGHCYGQTDVGLKETFEAEAATVRQLLDEDGGSAAAPLRIFSSPLTRCLRLARQLWPGAAIQTEDVLKELHFGAWENRPWADLEGPGLTRWMEDFVDIAAPDGESYRGLYERCRRWWDATIDRGAAPTANASAVIVTHAGVIRSLLCHCAGTELSASFHAYNVPYGSVYRLDKENAAWTIRLLYIQATVR